MSESKGESTHKLVYKDYLQLETKILNAQVRISNHHDEVFFIIVHQVYELWFKSNIHDLKSVMESLQKVDFVKLNRVNEKLKRMTSIMKLCIDQLQLLETLNPSEFMGFRSHLFPASGFESYQFRIFENTFGLKEEDRLGYGKDHYKQKHPDEIRKQIEKSETEPTFLTAVQKWLEQVYEEEEKEEKEEEKKKKEKKEKPIKQFWTKFESGVKSKIDAISSQEKGQEETKKAIDVWQSIITKELHDEKVVEGSRKMSFNAWKVALAITYLRNRQEKYAVAYNFLDLVRDADNFLMRWRFHHVQMVHRQIGDKAGTGGTESGYGYLKSTVVDQYRVFKDLFDLHGFLLEPKYLQDYYD